MFKSHCEPHSGHLGIEKTYDKIAREYFWPGVNYNVKIWNPVRCLSVVAADITGPFPPSRQGFRYILVFQDYVTRWIEVKPRSADGKAIARAFEDLVLFRWETPNYFLSDYGTEFINKVLAKTFETYGVKQITTPPYHPQANLVERSNRSLKIRSFVRADHCDWDVHLFEFRHAINTAVQASTKISPAFLNYGRHPYPVKSLRRQLEGASIIIRSDPAIWSDRVRRLDVL